MNKICFDLNLCKNKKLDNQIAVFEMCENIAAELGLQVLCKPNLFPYFYGKNHLDDGISCVCFIKNQKANRLEFFTLHTFNKRKVVYFDLLTSQDIDKNEVKRVLTKYIRPQEVLEETSYDGRKAWGLELWGDFKAEKDLGFGELYSLTQDIIEQIGMTKISQTMIESLGETKIAISLIAESHVAFMYNQKTKEFCVDIFSCKFFDKNIAINLIKKYAGSEPVCKINSRGLNHEGK